MIPLTESAVENFLRDAMAVLSAPNLPAAVGTLVVNPGHALQDYQGVRGVARGLAPFFSPAFTG
ncbi:MAG TPA: hypothetical protein VGV87_11095 [Blastocatellia bacterium]|nr:hypothetical protein [Blastocatellia bacterium]